MTGPMPVPPESKEQRENRAIADALEHSLDQLTAAMNALILWKQRVYKAAVIAIVIACTTLGLFFWYFQVTADRIHAAQVSACEDSGNSLRTGEDKVWHQFIAIATHGKPQSPVNQVIIRQLFTYVDGVFKPVDCRKLYP